MSLSFSELSGVFCSAFGDPVCLLLAIVFVLGSDDFSWGVSLRVNERAIQFDRIAFSLLNGAFGLLKLAFGVLLINGSHHEEHSEFVVSHFLKYHQFMVVGVIVFVVIVFIKKGRFAENDIPRRYLPLLIVLTLAIDAPIFVAFSLKHFVSLLTHL